MTSVFTKEDKNIVPVCEQIFREESEKLIDVEVTRELVVVVCVIHLLMCFPPPSCVWKCVNMCYFFPPSPSS